MAKKAAAKVEEIIEILRDDKATEVIIGKLGDTWAPAIKIMLNEKVDKIVDEVLLKLDSIMEKKIKELVSPQLEIIQQKYDKIEDENLHLRSRISPLEAETRLSDLVLHGLEEKLASDTTREAAEREAIGAALNLCVHTLDLQITEADFSTAYRLPRKGKEKCRLVVARFNSIRVRNMIFRARTKLRKTQVYINEHLSSVNAQIYAKARNLVKEGKASSAWTAGGIVFLLSGDGQGLKPKKIASLAILEKMTCDTATYIKESGGLLPSKDGLTT